MNIDFYYSTITATGLGLCIFASFYIYKHLKHKGALFMGFGFVIITLTYLSITYCVGVATLTDLITDYPYLCSPAIPHINGIGYFLVGYGLYQLAILFKNA